MLEEEQVLGARFHMDKGWMQGLSARDGDSKERPISAATAVTCAIILLPCIRYFQVLGIMIANLV